jgi:hypothetical protein
MINFAEYGNNSLGGETKTNGTFNVTETAADLHTFSANVTRVGGIHTEITYSGTVQGGYTGATTWNGSGSISRDGITIGSGEVEASTVNQVRDNAACGGEPASGTTTMTSDSHTVVITYDGATDCTDKHTAKWTKDGEDMGSIEGITCSSGRSGAGGLLFVLVALVWARRRPRAPE